MKSIFESSFSNLLSKQCGLIICHSSSLRLAYEFASAFSFNLATYLNTDLMLGKSGSLLEDRLSSMLDKFTSLGCSATIEVLDKKLYTGSKENLKHLLTHISNICSTEGSVYCLRLDIFKHKFRNKFLEELQGISRKNKCYIVVACSLKADNMLQVHSKYKDGFLSIIDESSVFSKLGLLNRRLIVEMYFNDELVSINTKLANGGVLKV